MIHMRHFVLSRKTAITEKYYGMRKISNVYGIMVGYSLQSSIWSKKKETEYHILGKLILRWEGNENISEFSKKYVISVQISGSDTRSLVNKVRRTSHIIYIHVGSQLLFTVYELVIPWIWAPLRHLLVHS